MSASSTVGVAPNPVTLQGIIDDVASAGVLQPTSLTEIKKHCRMSDDCVRVAHKALMAHLERDHSQIRLVCLQIIEHLFSRSAIFRKLTVESFKQVIVAACLQENSSTLPPPKSYAKLLKEAGLKFVLNCNEKWASQYKQLQLAYDYLLRTQSVDMRSIADERFRVEQQESQRQRLRAISHKQALQRIQSDVKANLPDIESVLFQLDQCLPLVVPKFDLSGEATTIQDSDVQDLIKITQEEDVVQGLAPSTEEVTISVNVESSVEVHETTDNEAIVNTVRDLYKRLCKTHRPWLEFTLTRLQQNQESDASAMLPDLINLKSRLVAAMSQCDDLRVIAPRSPGPEIDSDSSSSDSDELEEVETATGYKEGYEPEYNEGTSSANPVSVSGVASDRVFGTGDLSDIQQMRDLGLCPGDENGDKEYRGKQKRKRKKKRPDTLADPRKDRNNPAARILSRIKRARRNKKN